jgi:hypothetical protein
MKKSLVPVLSVFGLLVQALVVLAARRGLMGDGCDEFNQVVYSLLVVNAIQLGLGMTAAVAAVRTRRPLYLISILCAAASVAWMLLILIYGA